jgi:4,5-dihydroxyphthalate decarboxylase
MAKVKLTLACADYDRVRALRDGAIRPDGIELDFVTMRPVQAFERMLAKREFHASEMSLASYIALRAADRCPFVATPCFYLVVFVTTSSLQTWTLGSAARGILKASE